MFFPRALFLAVLCGPTILHSKMSSHKKSKEYCIQQKQERRRQVKPWNVTSQLHILVSWSWCYDFSITSGQTCRTEEANWWLLAHRALDSLKQKSHIYLLKSVLPQQSHKWPITQWKYFSNCLFVLHMRRSQVKMECSLAYRACLKKRVYSGSGNPVQSLGI